MENNMELKDIIAKNIAEYRKLNNWTQSDLAAKLSYTDKAVSKWERGESIPDVLILKSISDLFGITLNDLIDQKIKRNDTENVKKLIAILSVGLLFLVSTVGYVVWSLVDTIKYSWLLYIVTLPLSFVILIIYASMWWSKKMLGVMVSGLIWTSLLSAFLSLRLENRWLFFIIGIPLQILTVVWIRFKIKKKGTKR